MRGVSGLARAGAKLRSQRVNEAYRWPTVVRMLARGNSGHAEPDAYRTLPYGRQVLSSVDGHCTARGKLS